MPWEVCTGEVYVNVYENEFVLCVSPKLRKYVLEHRDDIEAMRALFYHPSWKWKTMPPLATADGTQIEENIRIAEEAIAQRVQQEKNNQD